MKINQEYLEKHVQANVDNALKEIKKISDPTDIYDEDNDNYTIMVETIASDSRGVYQPDAILPGFEPYVIGLDKKIEDARKETAKERGEEYDIDHPPKLSWDETAIDLVDRAADIIADAMNAHPVVEKAKLSFSFGKMPDVGDYGLIVTMDPAPFKAIRKSKRKGTTSTKKKTNQSDDAKGKKASKELENVKRILYKLQISTPANQQSLEDELKNYINPEDYGVESIQDLLYGDIGAAGRAKLAKQAGVSKAIFDNIAIANIGNESKAKKGTGKKNRALPATEGKILGFSWSNVDGSVVDYNPASKVLGFLQGPEGAGSESLKGCLASDDQETAHVGLMRKAASKTEVDLGQHEQDKSAYLRYVGPTDNPGGPSFIELGSDAFDLYGKHPKHFEVWLTLPGFNEVFSSEDMGNEDALDERIKTYAKKIRDKTSNPGRSQEMVKNKASHKTSAANKARVTVIQTRKYYVVMTDKGMSGWGAAEKKINKIVIGTDDGKLADRIAENARNRKGFKNISIRTTKPYYDESSVFVSYHEPSAETAKEILAGGKRSIY